MGSTFNPDYGLFVKENYNTDLFLFYGLATDHIMRVGMDTYSFFTTYDFDGTTYGLSLDFDVEHFPAFVNILSPYFSPDDLGDLKSKLTDPEFKHNILEWNEPIGDFNCNTTLGEIQQNQNESYIPFIIQAFI